MGRDSVEPPSLLPGATESRPTGPPQRLFPACKCGLFCFNLAPLKFQRAAREGWVVPRRDESGWKIRHSILAITMKHKRRKIHSTKRALKLAALGGAGLGLAWGVKADTVITF